MAIEVGTKLEGKVTGITHFGAFVDLSGGVTGLVHISEIADNYVKDVNDHLKISDVVTVKVINVDKDGKIGLSIKQAVDKPASEVRPPRAPRPERPSGGDRFGGGGGSGGGGGGGFNRERGGRPFKPAAGKPSFEDKMSRFLKDSEERISSIKKNTEGKRGGRGAKRV
ncbi:RNA-binding protein S1 [Paenibacillus sp. VTT E-133280]|jgi:S1 RNA binding domain protein|uniref:S1 domain-containing RNA-binding protein n=1 Tax=unclassified Paenibacillus TaxID=185978 RepID=UPI000BA15E5F|nr:MULTISPECIES: S1 domain-containing RNA-binding protein [unclassified Paenibacillus]MDH6374713.1 S1 RNA binding domain protein [Paenibacillus sp. PastF-3]OZQ63619.1 RNA-binding protein S1 [Paenibacillus sp. VTT E-133280]OZQ87389.1 RNA-binding protein S1 [Paenibacillus sp. VTT E-133291]